MQELYVVVLLVGNINDIMSNKDITKNLNKDMVLKITLIWFQEEELWKDLSIMIMLNKFQMQWKKWWIS